MRALNIALFGAVAFSAASYLLAQNPDPVSAATASPVTTPEIIISEKPMAGFLSLETPVSEKKKVHTPSNPVITPEPEQVVQPVQPLEDRTDEMLFEAEALSFLPFDQAVVMPFD